MILSLLNLPYYKCHKTSFKHGSLYIDSPDWIKIRKATINPNNYQYAATVALNLKETVGHPERVSNIKPFINKHNYEKIKYLSGNDGWRKIEKNNFNIALNMLYENEMKICPAYISKYNSTRRKTNYAFYDP